MNMKKTLNAFFKVIAQEAESNPVFSARLEAALGLENKKSSEKSGLMTPETGGGDTKRASNRRPRALIDPVQLARRGEIELREELIKLNIEQLRDVVAEYGMDTGKLVLKWRNPERIVERIVEVARSRAQKGNAFRDSAYSESSIDNPEIISEMKMASDPKSIRASEGLVGTQPEEPAVEEQPDRDEEKPD